jgi:hypothetical protein
MAKPVAGWYASPENEGMLRWWDGNDWTEAEMPVPEEPEPSLPAPTGAPVIAGESKKKTDPEKVKNIAVGSAIGVAGAALAAQGAIGLGKERKGFAGLGKWFIWGTILFVLGVFVAIGAAVGAVPSENGTSAVPGGILMALIGIILFVVGSVKLVIRAGSVVGGVYLMKQGLKTGTKKTDE